MAFGFGRKRSANSENRYDHENLIPAIRCSICTGEQVAGFCHRENGHFTEVMLIRSPEDLMIFREKYDIQDEIRKIY